MNKYLKSMFTLNAFQDFFSSVKYYKNFTLLKKS